MREEEDIYLFASNLIYSSSILRKHHLIKSKAFILQFLTADF